MKKLLFLILFPFLAYTQTIQRSWIEHQNMAAGMVRDSASIVTPEHWGVVGDGTVNDSSAVVAMFEGALGKTLLFTDSLYVWDKVIDIDCDDQAVTMVSNNNSRIYSTAENPDQIYFAFWIYQATRPDVGAIYSTGGSEFLLVDTLVTEGYLGQRISGTGAISTTGTLTKVSGTGGSASYSYTTLIMQDGRYYLPLGAINFDNASGVTIDGIQFEFDNSSGYSRSGGDCFDGILIKNSENIQFTNNSITDAVQWGLRLYNVDNANVSYNKIDSCLFGGIGFNAVNGGLVGWNQIDNIGVNAPINGYGIGMSHQSGTWEDNINIDIVGNTVSHCLYTAIDIRNGVGVNVNKNKVFAFGSKGIVGYNTGGFEEGHLNYVNDLKITDNVIENDSSWFADLAWGYGITGYDEPYTIGISVGSYEWGRPASGDAQNGVIVSRNILKNLTVYQTDTLQSIFAIRVFSGYTGTVLISDNVVDSSTVVHGISVANGNDTTYTTQLQNLDITGNAFTNVSALGIDSDPGAIILATTGEHINISNNRLIRCNSYQSYGIWVTEISPNIVGNVKINDNHIDGDTSSGSEKGIGYGIYLRAGNYQANNNSFSGNMLTGRCIVPFVSLHGTQYNNIYYNDDYTIQNLPDYTSNTTGKLNIDFYKDSSSAVDTIATMMVNGGNSYPYAINGIANFLVTVSVTSNLSGEQAIYQYNMWCKNDTTDIDVDAQTPIEFIEQDSTLPYIEKVTFGVDTLTSQVFEGSEDFPVVFWQNIADGVIASGRLRRIDIYCDKPESVYSVEIKFNGYKLMPYYMTY